MQSSGPLVCPESRQPLREMSLAEANRDVVPGGDLQVPDATGYRPIGCTRTVLVRADGLAAYPVVDGFPVLLRPEMLVAPGHGTAVDVTAPRYAEAYSEMDHYNERGRADAAAVLGSQSLRDLQRIMNAPAGRFPDPPDLWLDAKYELGAQYDAFRRIGPVAGRRVLQIGGSGLHAVRLLLAGAAEAWLVSPMVGELAFGAALARECGVADRLRCCAGLAEELPFVDATFDVVYSQGCVHHWLMPLAVPECARVLTDRGRFAAVEPWRGPLYGIGTSVLGKRDRQVRCVVLSADRIGDSFDGFSDLRILHHGALTRYPLLALWKLGIKFSRRTVWRLGRVDDAITSVHPRLRDAGSSVAIVGRRPVRAEAAAPAGVR